MVVLDETNSVDASIIFIPCFVHSNFGLDQTLYGEGSSQARKFPKAFFKKENSDGPADQLYQKVTQSAVWKARLLFCRFLKKANESTMRRNNEKQTRYVPHHSGTCWRPVKKKVSTASVVFFFFLLVSALVFLGRIDIVSLYSYIFFNPYGILSSALQQLNLHTDYRVDLPYSIWVTKTCNGITKKFVSQSLFP